MSTEKVSANDIGKVKAPPRRGELFFDSWSPQMAWCLGVIYERGAVHPERGTAVVCSDLPLLKAFRELVEESKLYRDRRGVVIESTHIGDRLMQLGMDKGFFNVKRVPPVPKEYTRYLMRGILDTQGATASFGSYLAEIELEFSSCREACVRFMRCELEGQGYHVDVKPREIDFLGISNKEPVDYVRSLKMTNPREIIDCYKWLYGKPDARIPFNRAQRWIWSQLHWMLRDLDACSRMLEDKEMVSELRKVIKHSSAAKLMGDWHE